MTGPFFPNRLHEVWLIWKRTKYGFDVEDRGAVERLEMANAKPAPVDRDNLHRMEPDRVRAVGRARVEDSLNGIGRVAARVYPQDITSGAIEPREDDDLISRPDTVEALEHIWFDHQPGIGCSFVALRRGGLPIGQRRLDAADRYQLQVLFQTAYIRCG